MQIGDLVQLLNYGRQPMSEVGVVVEFDHHASGVLCLVKGENMWYRINQVEVVSASR